MIIRNNVASTPVRNYSVFLLSCAALTILVTAFTLINIQILTNSFSQSSQLTSKISEQMRQKSSLQKQTNDLRATITRIKTPAFVTETDFMNNAIKRRVFSWTTLFDQFEKVLPDNVKMTMVTPNIKDEKIMIGMEVAGRSLADILDLVQRLQKSGVFQNVVFRSERQDPDGLLSATISLEYLPDQATAPAAIGAASPETQQAANQTTQTSANEEGDE